MIKVSVLYICVNKRVSSSGSQPCWTLDDDALATRATSAQQLMTAVSRKLHFGHS
jgi:hypothetical protein